MVASQARWSEDDQRAFILRQEKRWGPLDESEIRRILESARAWFLTGASRLFLCRGCCCGTERVQAVDHDVLVAHVDSERRRLGLALAVDLTDCQGPCDEGNNATVRVGSACRTYRKLNDPAAMTRMLEEIREGYSRSLPT